VVVLATPYSSTEAAITACGNLAGKIVVDCTNPVAPDLSGLTIGHSGSAGEAVARWAKGYQGTQHDGLGQHAEPTLRQRNLEHVPLWR
jgi:predicted dinucleotide-binding enzyme